MNIKIGDLVTWCGRILKVSKIGRRRLTGLVIGQTGKKRMIRGYEVMTSIENVKIYTV